MLRDYHVNNHAWNFLALIVFLALKVAREVKACSGSRWKQGSRYIFATQADVKSKLMTLGGFGWFRVLVATEISLLTNKYKISIVDNDCGLWTDTAQCAVITKY